MLSQIQMNLITQEAEKCAVQKTPYTVSVLSLVHTCGEGGWRTAVGENFSTVAFTLELESGWRRAGDDAIQTGNDVTRVEKFSTPPTPVEKGGELFHSDLVVGECRQNNYLVPKSIAESCCGYLQCQKPLRMHLALKS
jgi:hypothetical protein